MKWKLLIAAVVVVGISTAGVFANEAYKEVYYLCGNFKPGVTYESLVKQLDTAELSSYTIAQTTSGERVVLSSQLNLNYFHCTIDVDTNHVIEVAVFESGQTFK